MFVPNVPKRMPDQIDIAIKIWLVVGLIWQIKKAITIVIRLNI